MTHHTHAIFRRMIATGVLMTLAVLGISSSVSDAKESTSNKTFKWDTITYNGGSCVTLRNIKSFYGFKEMTLKKKSIILKNSKVEVTFTLDSQNCRMNGVLFILSHPVVKHKGKYLLSRTDFDNLIDPIFRPSYIKKAKVFNTIVIDAGHGGKDPGSRGSYSNEKVYTLKVARYLRDMLKKKGYKVIMTRDTDVFISLAGRVRIANKHPSAIFVSIHFNSGQSRAHGIETFTISPVGVPHLGRSYRPRDARAVPGNIMGSASIALATAVHSRTLTYLNNSKYGNNFKISDRGIKHARFNVLTGIKIPAILLEGGFLSNRSEAGKVHSSAYQKTLAAAVVHAIDIYKESITRATKQPTNKKEPKESDSKKTPKK